MRWPSKKNDPVSDRAQALNAEIAALEAEIKKLDQQLQPPPTEPRPRTGSTPPAPVAAATHHDPVFERINQTRITTRQELPNAPEYFNEFGDRKLDFPALLQRLRNFFSGPNTSNPKLVSYLAAGGVQGLQPLRKERRVARNRFLFFATLLFLMLFGIVWWYWHNR